jgi:hypothetical protein
MGLLGFNISEGTQRNLASFGAGIGIGYFGPKGLSKLGQYIGRNVAQEMKASLNPGMQTPGTNAGYDMGSAEVYNTKLANSIDKLTSIVGELNEQYKKKGG